MLSSFAATLLALAPGDNPHKKWIDILSVGSLVTPPTVAVVESLSGPDRTVLEVRVPGFWAETGVAADGKTYVRYALPEPTGAGAFAATTGQVGAPELPALEIVLALPPGATESPILYGDYTGTTVMYLDVEETAGDVAGAVPLPLHTPGWDGDPDSGIPTGIAPQFQLDPVVYGGTELYPAEQVAVGDPFVLAGGISAVPIELRPIRYDPVQNQLAYHAEFRIQFDHPGAPGALGTVSHEAALPAETFTMNYEEIQGTYLELDPGAGRTARMLMLASKEHADELLPLIEQRRLTGFDVELRSLESLPDTQPATIRAALGQFLDAAKDGHDSYALLVGDVDRIPLHPPLDPNGNPGDGPYGRPLVDPGQRLFVGRLSVDDDADLAHQVEKILQFERVKAGSHHVTQFGLAAHQHQAAGIVDTNDYAIWQQDFGAALEAAGFLVDLVSGAQAGSSTKLQETLAQGTFLLYSGFGSAFGWPTWTVEQESLTPGDVLAFENESTPIHLAFAPRTAAIDEDDSLAEAWLAAEHGAVAAFGALTSTQTSHGYKLERCFVKSWSISGDASPPVGLLIAAVQAADGMSVADDDRYLLVGDPGLTVPTGTSAATDDVFIDGKIITAENFDAAIEIGPGGGSLTFDVEDSNGNPVDGVLVSLVIGGAELGPNGELLPPVFQQDVYSVNGKAVIDFAELATGGLVLPPSKDTGSVNFVFADGSVKFIKDSIDVLYGDAADLGGGVAGSLGVAPRLVSVDTLEPGGTLDLGLTDAPADSLAVLFLSAGATPLPVEGGVFHAWPILVSWVLGTDSAGESSFALGPLPTALPLGLELVFQAVVVDSGTPTGLTLSNGLQFAN